MLWIRSGIEIHWGGDEKNNDHAEPTQVERLKKIFCDFNTIFIN